MLSVFPDRDAAREREVPEESSRGGMSAVRLSWASLTLQLTLRVNLATIHLTLVD